ncbi:MAG: hypothetical protein R3Y59_08500 [bacterium]
MKKLRLKDVSEAKMSDIFSDALASNDNKADFVSDCKRKLEFQTIEFYDTIGVVLRYIGFSDPRITREGDVNCRMDAIIVDNTSSIPIEIKSPRETMEINIKSIRQAFENKVVILSRKFHHTTFDTTSLAIAFNYPPIRSDVYELINNIKQAFDINIGIINIDDLLGLVYDCNKNNLVINREYFNNFAGKFEYEKAFTQTPQ